MNRPFADQLLEGRALGATLRVAARPKTVLTMVLSQAITIAVVGEAIGAAAAIAIGRVIQSEVHTPGGVNPAAIAWPAAMLNAVMLAASAIPAARAGSVNLLAFAEGELSRRRSAAARAQKDAGSAKEGVVQ